LAIRPIEALDTGDAAPAEATARTQPGPAADSAARAALAAAEAGARTFDALLDKVEPVIRAGASSTVGSDAWLEAQMALSRLQAARLATSDALLALDDELATQGASPVLEEAHARAMALVKDQTGKYAALAALLPVN
jgi:hypothetical protein